MSSKVKMLVLVAIVVAGGLGLVYWKTQMGEHSEALTEVTKEQMEMLVKDLNPMQQRQIAENPEAKKDLAKNLKEFLAIASQARKEGFADKPEVKQELKYMEKALLALSYDKLKNKDKPMPPLTMITEEQVVEFWGKDPEEDKKKSEDEKEKPGADEKEVKAEDTDEKTGDDKDPDTEKVDGDDADKKPADSDADSAKEDKSKEKKTANAEESKGFLESIGLGGWIAKSKAKRNETDFQQFLKAQKKLEQGRGQRPPGQENMSPEQIKQMRDSFARFSIYEEEAKAKLGTYAADARENERTEIAKLDTAAKDFEEKKKAIEENTKKEIKEWEEFKPKVEFQTKLQQSQLLAQLYARDKLVPQLEVSEEDVAKYINEHPELIKEKKDKAEEILKKAIAGDDFAKLAKEFSEDPGSKEKGGLYEKVPLKQMVPAFEKAALALEPGQVASELVKTKFGYHIIKLEKKGDIEEINGKKTETYTTRHILISTTVKDEKNPLQREIPIDDFVTNKLKTEKQDEILAKILSDNPIEVAEDFDVTPPPVPQQPQLPEGLQLPQQAPPPAPEKKADEKK